MGIVGIGNYHRLEVQEKVKDFLDLPARRKIYFFIRSNPGMHFREIQRVLDLSVGQLDFHLNEMVKRELLTKEASQGNARYYVRDSFKPVERRIMSFLRKEVTRSLILFIKDHPGSNPSEILDHFKISGPNLSYHLARMVKNGILRSEQSGRIRKYFLMEVEMVDDLLITYRSTLFDRLIDDLGP